MKDFLFVHGLRRECHLETRRRGSDPCVLAIWFWLVKPMLEPYLGSLPYANLALATATGLVLLVLPLVWGRKAEAGPT